MRFFSFLLGGYSLFALAEKSVEGEDTVIVGPQRELQSSEPDSDNCANDTDTFHFRNQDVLDAYNAVHALIYREIIRCIEQTEDSTCYIDSRNATTDLYETCSDVGGLFVLSKCNLVFSVPGRTLNVTVDNNGNCAANRDACGTAAITYSELNDVFNATEGSCIVYNVTSFSTNLTTEPPVNSTVEECASAASDLYTEHVAVSTAADRLVAAFEANAGNCFHTFQTVCPIDFQTIEEGQLFTNLVVACIEAGGVLVSMNCNMTTVVAAYEVLHSLHNFGFCGVSRQAAPACDPELFAQIALPEYYQNCTVNEVMDGANYNITAYRDQCNKAVRELARSSSTLGSAIEIFSDALIDEMKRCALAKRGSCLIDFSSPGLIGHYNSLERNCTIAGGKFVSSDCNFTAFENGLSIDFEIYQNGNCFVSPLANGSSTCDPSWYSDYAYVFLGANASFGRCDVHNDMNVQTPSPSSPGVSTGEPPKFELCQKAFTDLIQDSPLLLDAYDDFVTLFRQETTSCMEDFRNPCVVDLKRLQQGQVYQEFLLRCEENGGIFVVTNCSYTLDVVFFEINNNAECVVAESESHACDPEKYEEYSWWAFDLSASNGKCTMGNAAYDYPDTQQTEPMPNPTISQTDSQGLSASSAKGMAEGLLTRFFLMLVSALVILTSMSHGV
jgi:hypothetical protein